MKKRTKVKGVGTTPITRNGSRGSRAKLLAKKVTSSFLTSQRPIQGNPSKATYPTGK